MKTSTTSYSETVIITPEMHRDLIGTIERKLKPNSQIKVDYFEAKNSSPPANSWEDAFIRSTACVVSVRITND